MQVYEAVGLAFSNRPLQAGIVFFAAAEAIPGSQTWFPVRVFIMDHLCELR